MQFSNNHFNLLCNGFPVKSIGLLWVGALICWEYPKDLVEVKDQCAIVSKPSWPQDSSGGLLFVLDRSLRTCKDRRVDSRHVHIHILVCEWGSLSLECLSTASLLNHYNYLVNSDLSFLMSLLGRPPPPPELGQPILVFTFRVACNFPS